MARLLHHLVQLSHRIWIVILVVKACNLFVLHLALDVTLALLTAVEEVVKFYSTVALKISVILCQLHEVHEAFE